MPAHTLKDLLRLALGGLYQDEQDVLQLVDAMETDTQSRLLRDWLRAQREGAHRGVVTLERCFELLGTDPPRAGARALRCIAEERQAFVHDGPSALALEAYHLDSGLRAARYRQAAYQSAVALARDSEQADVARLVEQGAQHQLAAADWVEHHRQEVLEEVRPSQRERAYARPT